MPLAKARPTLCMSETQSCADTATVMRRDGESTSSARIGRWICATGTLTRTHLRAALVKAVSHREQSMNPRPRRYARLIVCRLSV